jgi:hypothetical protein
MNIDDLVLHKIRIRLFLTNLPSRKSARRRGDYYARVSNEAVLSIEEVNQHAYKQGRRYR